MHWDETRNNGVLSVCSEAIGLAVIDKKLFLLLLLFGLFCLCRLFLSDAKQIAQISKIFLNDHAESLGVKA